MDQVEAINKSLSDLSIGYIRGTKQGGKWTVQVAIDITMAVVTGRGESFVEALADAITGDDEPWPIPPVTERI